MKTPFHLWIIGIISLLWNASGAYDYVMTQTKNVVYLEMLSDAQKAFLDAGPVWFEAAWAVGVWFSVLGSLLLLLRSRFAGTAFGLSFAGLMVSSVYSFGLGIGQSSRCPWRNWALPSRFLSCSCCFGFTRGR